MFTNSQLDQAGPSINDNDYQIESSNQQVSTAVNEPDLFRRLSRRVVCPATPRTIGSSANRNTYLPSSNVRLNHSTTISSRIDELEREIAHLQFIRRKYLEEQRTAQVELPWPPQPAMSSTEQPMFPVSNRLPIWDNYGASTSKTFPQEPPIPNALLSRDDRGRGTSISLPTPKITDPWTVHNPSTFTKMQAVNGPYSEPRTPKIIHARNDRRASAWGAFSRGPSIPTGLLSGNDHIPGTSINLSSPITGYPRGMYGPSYGPSTLTSTKMPADSGSHPRPWMPNNMHTWNDNGAPTSNKYHRKEPGLLVRTPGYRPEGQDVRMTHTSFPWNDRGPSTSNASVPQSTIDYRKEFPWSAKLASNLRNIFRIKEFRLCQEAACNANSHERHTVCIMPAGSGKSLTYQLPAVGTRGFTLVISPSISLINDQVLQLHELGVEAVALTEETSPAEVRSILERLTGKATALKDIKLCYITRAREAGYKKDIWWAVRSRPPLSRILIATYQPELYSTRLSVSPKLQNTTGDNLVYKVVPKSSNMAKTIESIVKYIQQYQENHTGIIFCSAQKEADEVAKALAEASSGEIEPAVCHAGVARTIKDQVHRQWRDGLVKVICTTGEFGLGINNPDVRFVLHYSMPVCPIALPLRAESSRDLAMMKASLEDLYQEWGRAGRDGDAADCILYFRGQDAIHAVLLAHGDRRSKEPVYSMAQFALETAKCRQTAIVGLHSSFPSQRSTKAPSATGCGHCDNCEPSLASGARLDVTGEAWKLCCILEIVTAKRGYLTVQTLAAIARGNRKGKYPIDSGDGAVRGPKQSTATLNAATVCGGKVCELSQDVSPFLGHRSAWNVLLMPSQETENLIVCLVVRGYMKAVAHPAVRGPAVYIEPGPKIDQFTARYQAAIKDSINPTERVFLRVSSKHSMDKVAKGSATVAKAVPKKGSNQRGNLSEGKGKATVQDDEAMQGEEHYADAGRMGIWMPGFSMCHWPKSDITTPADPEEALRSLSYGLVVPRTVDGDVARSLGRRRSDRPQVVDGNGHSDSSSGQPSRKKLKRKPNEFIVISD
ncbi:hypothetical protein FRB90_009915 [Tulasnella sp. 427]|nr:hypothetical protein FRB90_009915 [Tulasnella sp. 427]